MDKALFKKIPKKKVRDKVFDQIKSLIVEGTLLPGQKIPPELELCDLFSVSRSSVREAVLRLECLGFVEQRHGEGTFVKSVTESVILNYTAEMASDRSFFSGLMEIREVLEIWAARTAADRASEKDIKDLVQIVRIMESHSGPLPPKFDQNVDLHCRIAAASHNPFLIHMMGSILDWIGTVTDRIYDEQSHPLDLFNTLTRQHRMIVDAIAAGDGEAAANAMADHLEFAAKQTRQAPVVPTG